MLPTYSSWWTSGEWIWKKLCANSELLFSSSLASTKSLSSLTIVGSGSNSKLKDFSSFKKFLPFYLKLSVPALLSTCKNFSCVAPSFLLFFFFLQFHFLPLTNLKFPFPDSFSLYWCFCRYIFLPTDFTFWFDGLLFCF